MKGNYTTFSNKIEDKKIPSLLRQVKRTYHENYNTALTMRQNFILWARDVQGLTYKQIGEVFDVTLQRIEQEYRQAKGGRS